MKKLLDIIGALAFWGLVILLAWLYLEATPNQLSGEADWTAKEAEDAGEEYCPGIQ
jgi:hypothetical protein